MAEAKRIDSYKNRSSYVYPSDNINPELKNSKEYRLAFCKAFMAEYASNNCQVPYKWGDDEISFERLRQFAEGREGPEQVKKSFFGEKKRDPKTGKYPTTINTNWDGTDIMPKFFDVMRAINQKIEYRTTSRAIDGESLLSKRLDREYLKWMIDEKVKGTMAKAKYHPNTPVSLEDIGAETESDVDLYFDSGAYVTEREIASDACTQKTRKESDFKTIQDMLFDDAITLGIICGKNYIDKANNVVKTRYVDPAKCLIQYSKYLDHRNDTKFAELRTMSIGELREEFPHVPAYQWRIIARDFMWMNPESAVALSQYGIFNKETMNVYGQDALNSCNIPVMDAQWLTEDTEKRLTNEKNKDFYKEVDFGYEVSKSRARTGDKVIQKNFIRKHYASWIVGTDFLLDHGMAEDVVYYGKDGNKIPKLDFFVQKIGNKSIVERCITHLEDIRLATVKLRNAVATLPPAPRMIIQQQLMDNVWLNGIQQQPEDLMQRFLEKGVLVVNTLDDFNKPIFQNGKAIEFVPAGVLEDINLFTMLINQGIERIRDVTGLNAAADASTPNAYVGLGKSQLAQNSANNALSPTFNVFAPFFTRLSDDQVKKWQIVVKKNKSLKLDYAPLGINTMQTLEIGEDFVNSDFGLYTEMEFTEDERQTLFGQIIELNKSYTNTQGGSGLNTAEFMHLQDLVMAGQFRFAKYVIARTEKKRELMAIKVKRQSEQFTFESQQKSLVLNNRMKQEAVSDEERKKLLTARVTEIEKRITKLYDSVTAENSDPAIPKQTDGIMTLIMMNQEQINTLIQQDADIDKQKMQQTMQGGQQVA